MSQRALTIDRHVTPIHRGDDAGASRGARPCPPQRWREYLDAIL